MFKYQKRANSSMTSAYKKAPPQVEIPVEELRVLPEHIFAKVGGFDVHFKKNGRAEASRSYSNIGVSVLQEQGGRTSEKKELAKEIEVKLTFGVASFPPDVYFVNERVHANFKLGEERHSIEGIFFEKGDVSWSEGEKGNVLLGERFINTVDRDIRSFHEKLDWAMKFDKRLAPALAAEASSNEALKAF